jgi:hypothetical protein
VLTYVPVGSAELIRSVTATRSGFVIKSGATVEHRDLWGHREGSPLFGQRSNRRAGLWDRIADLGLAIERGETVLMSQVEQLEANYQDLLNDDPMHLAAILLIGRSLARAGRCKDGAALLEASWARHHRSTWLGLSLARYRAICGQRSAAYDTWYRTIAMADGTAPNRFEALRDLARLASLHGNDAAFAEGVRLVESCEGHPVDQPTRRDLAAIWAFFRGRWQDPSLDALPPSLASDDVAAFRAWAQLERGEGFEALASEIERLSGVEQTAPLAWLIEARQQLALNQPERALGNAERALERLTALACTSVKRGVWIPVTEWIIAQSLVKLGRHEEAAVYQKRTRDRAPNCWFSHNILDARVERHRSLPHSW